MKKQTILGLCVLIIVVCLLACNEQKEVVIETFDTSSVAVDSSVKALEDSIKNVVADTTKK